MGVSTCTCRWGCVQADGCSYESMPVFYMIDRLIDKITLFRI